MDRPRLHNPSNAYHEAGHAVVLWHYGIRFRYVTLRPKTPGHAGHVYVGRLREITGLAELETDMRVSAAGQIAKQWIFRLDRIPREDDAIVRELGRAVVSPDSPWVDDDIRNFVRIGIERDSVALAESPDAATGPEGWLRIWRETERLVREELWPAVYAVAWEMVFSSRALTFADVDEIATLALAAASSPWSGPSAALAAGG